MVKTDLLSKQIPMYSTKLTIVRRLSIKSLKGTVSMQMILCIIWLTSAYSSFPTPETIILFCFYNFNFFFLESTCKCGQAIFFFLCLVYFTSLSITSSRLIHVVTNGKITFWMIEYYFITCMMYVWECMSIHP
jgi:hypothetical protein